MLVPDQAREEALARPVVNQVNDECPHDRTSLFDQSRPYLGSVSGRLRRVPKMISLRQPVAQNSPVRAGGSLEAATCPAYGFLGTVIIDRNVGDRNESFYFKLPRRRPNGYRRHDLGHRDGDQPRSLDPASPCPPQSAGLGISLPLRHLLSPAPGN